MNLLKSSLTYWVGRMGSRAVSFILIPIYTAYILPSEWGSLALLMISGDVFLLFSGCQLTAAFYKYWGSCPDEEARKKLTGIVFIASVCISLVLSIPVFYYSGFLSDLAGIKGHADYVQVLLVTELLAILLTVVQAEMRLRNEAKKYAFYDIFYNLGTATVNIFLVVALGWGIWGILVGQMFGFLLIVLLLAPAFFRRMTIGFDSKVLGKLFTFALPLIPSAVAMASVHNVDRYFVQFFHGAGAVGIYAIGYKFGTIVNILVTGPFLLVWEPKSYEIANSPEGADKIRKVFIWYLSISMFVVTGLVCFSKEIISIFAAQTYYEAWKVIPLVAISYLFFGMDSIVRIGLLVKNKTSTIFYIVLFSFLSNLILNFILVPTYGMLGAAISTIFSFFFLFTFDLYFSSKVLKIKFLSLDIVKILSASLIVIALSWIVNLLFDGIMTMMTIKSFIVLLFPFVLFVTGLITVQKIRDFKNLFFLNG